MIKSDKRSAEGDFMDTEQLIDLLTHCESSKDREKWARVIENRKPIVTPEWFTIEKDILFLKLYNKEMNIDEFLEGYSRFYNPPEEIKTKSDAHLYLPPVYFSYKDLEKHFSKEIKYLYKNRTNNELEDGVNEYLNRKSMQITEAQIEDDLKSWFKNEIDIKYLMKHLKSKGGILSGEICPAFNKEALKYNPYSRLLYNLTKEEIKVEKQDWEGYENEKEAMLMFLENIDKKNELEKFTKQFNHRDFDTLRKWGENKEIWDLLSEGIQTEEPLLFTDQKTLLEKAKIPVVALKAMGKEIDAKGILRLQKEQLKKWYKDNNIKNIDDLRMALEKDYSKTTTMSPEEVRAYVESIPYIKKRLSDVKGYTLIIPSRAEQGYLRIKEVTTFSEAEQYLRGRYHFNESECVAKGTTDHFGLVGVFAGYNEKNREEVFGYAIDRKYTQDKNEIMMVFVQVMKELARLAEDDELKTENGWQIGVVGNFIWPIHSRDFEAKIPYDVIGQWTSAKKEAVNNFIKKNMTYKNYAVATGQDQIGRILSVDRMKAELLGSINSVQKFSTTKQGKGIDIIGTKKTKEVYSATILGLTESESKELKKKVIGADGVLLINPEEVYSRALKYNWVETKGKLLKTGQYTYGMLLSNFEVDKPCGYYFTEAETIYKRNDWSISKVRKDQKQFEASLRDGQIRKYVFLTNEEYHFILKYMGVSKLSEINYKVLKRKIQFFYENMDIYLSLIHI